MFKKYNRKGYVEMRPYVEGEDVRSKGVSISDTYGELRLGDMISRDPSNHDDMWIISKEFFEKHYFSRKSNPAIKDRWQLIEHLNEVVNDFNATPANEDECIYMRDVGYAGCARDTLRLITGDGE